MNPNPLYVNEKLKDGEYWLERTDVGIERKVISLDDIGQRELLLRTVTTLQSIRRFLIYFTCLSVLSIIAIILLFLK